MNSPARPRVPKLSISPLLLWHSHSHLGVRLDRRVGEQNQRGGVDEVDHLNRVLPRGAVVSVPAQRLRQAVPLRDVRERLQLPSELGGHKLHLGNFGLRLDRQESFVSRMTCAHTRSGWG